MSKLEETSIQFVKGVGPARKKLFGNLGIESILDLFYFFPHRYEDRRQMTTIAQLKEGEPQLVTGKVLIQQARRSWYTKKHVSEVMIDDGTGRLVLTWFNQPYIEKYLEPNKKIVCFGKVGVYKNRLQMISPEYEVIESAEDELLSLGRIVPVYSLTRGITQRYLRKTLDQCLNKYVDELVDELPVKIRNDHHLFNIKRSIANIHFPESFDYQQEALKRISFEEFFFFQVSVILRRLCLVRQAGFAHQLTDTLGLRFVNGFPFELTTAQKRVINEIRADMCRPAPMLRLLQGDVGSGKTAVAVFGCFTAFHNNKQSAVMAPTEILARQHYQNIRELAEKGPLKGMKIALLVSSLKESEKIAVLSKVKTGAVDLVIGTHALINEKVIFKDLSYVVIDEQHKFGVRQRALLSAKGGNPDVLIMTATPIPRTLCITLYGDLDLSVIDEMPPGRGKITTRLFPLERCAEVYELVRQKVSQGRQAFIVYPIIEESASLDLKAAEKMYKQLAKNEFKGFKVGLVHGQMKQEEANDTMEKFKKKAIDILVATTILEVGVDIPNATVMVIEHAERFGLAQLHQLRGRIGRGAQDSLCLLLGEATNEDGEKRLKTIVKTTDGFKIAQADLEIRGPGHFFGRHQHGLNELKVANPTTQLDILELARKEAIALTQTDPKLEQSANRTIKGIIQKRYPDYLKDVLAG